MCNGVYILKTLTNLVQVNSQSQRIVRDFISCYHRIKQEPRREILIQTTGFRDYFLENITSETKSRRQVAKYRYSSEQDKTLAPMDHQCSHYNIYKENNIYVVIYQLVTNVKEHREDCRENLNRMFREARLRYLSILE